MNVAIEWPTHASTSRAAVLEQAQAALRALDGVSSVEIQNTVKVRSASAPEQGRPPLPGVKNVIAVGAGKGGVGKTTVSVNLALSLAKSGARVGILDGDIYGPNIPLMLGLQAELATDGEQIRPAEKFGLQVVSIGFLTGDDQAVIWRGPMVHGAIQQFFRDVGWRDLDYLIIDMPPGTGDVALSLSQTVPVAGAVLVTTPQQVSLADTPPRGPHVSEAGHPAGGHRREHELLLLPELSSRQRHLRLRRRRADGDGDGRAVSRPPADLSADQPGQRSRHSDRDRRARFGGVAGVCGGGGACGARRSRRPRIAVRRRTRARSR